MVNITNNYTCPVCGRRELTLEQLNECIAKHKTNFTNEKKIKDEVDKIINNNNVLITQIRNNCLKLKEFGIDCSVKLTYSDSNLYKNNDSPIQEDNNITTNEKKCECNPNKSDSKTNKNCDNKCESQKKFRKISQDKMIKALDDAYGIEDLIKEILPFI